MILKTEGEVEAYLAGFRRAAYHMRRIVTEAASKEPDIKVGSETNPFPWLQKKEV